MSEKAADVAHDFDEQRAALVASATHNLPIGPGLLAVPVPLRTSPGLNCLIGPWEELAGGRRGGPGRGADHHDRLDEPAGPQGCPAPADLEAAPRALDAAGRPRPVLAAAAVLRTPCRRPIADFASGAVAVLRPAGVPRPADRRGDRADLEGGAIAPPLRARAREGPLLRRSAAPCCCWRSPAPTSPSRPRPSPSPPRRRRPGRPRPRNRKQNLVIQRLVSNWLRSGKRPRPRVVRPARRPRRRRRGVP